MENSLIHQLQSLLNANVENDAYRNIAQYLLKNIYNDKIMENLSINDLADACFTSPSTVSRFSRNIGYKNFFELKSKCLNQRMSGLALINDNLVNLEFDFNNDQRILTDYNTIIQESMNDLINNLDFKEIDEFLELVYLANNIILYAIQLPGLFARYLQFILLSLGKYVEFYDLESKQFEASKQINEDSLSVIISVDGNYIRSNADILYNLKETGTKIILITQNHNINISDMFNKILYLGNFTNSKGGRYKLQMFIEILVNRYYLKYIKDKK